MTPIPISLGGKEGKAVDSALCGTCPSDGCGVTSASPWTVYPAVKVNPESVQGAQAWNHKAVWCVGTLLFLLPFLLPESS